jgi:Fe2+ transport system protein FeoA
VNATAVSTDTPLYSTDPLLVLGIVPGEQVSVIQDTAGGTLWVTELTH